MNPNNTSAFRRLRCCAELRKAATGICLGWLLAGCPSPPQLAITLPSDAQNACPLAAATFAAWFQSGSVSLNGVVNPANSLNTLVPNCGFYQWAEQMFMWLTSPAPSTYGGGTHIFDSPTFFDVSSPDASGNRTFVPHTLNFIHAAPLRIAKLGVHRLPVVIDRFGRLLEVRPVQPDLKPMVRDRQGKHVEVVHARVERGRLVLLGGNGEIIHPVLAGSIKPVDQNREVDSLIVQKFIIDRIPIFIDPSLSVVDTEQGQADGGVLQAQTTANGSLIYYATMVNDVYAYFLTGASKGAISTSPANQFPTTPTDLSNTVAFAVANGKSSPPFPDPNALAVEVKSAWVLAAGLPNLNSYITTMATIPTYNQSNPETWIQTGQQTVQVALVGMHVVGSTFGHPEMVWATFEHLGDAPVAAYSYTTSSGTQTVAQNTTGAWLFAASGAIGPFNLPHMAANGTAPSVTIQANPGFTVSPSDSLRAQPWGAPGPSTGSNTEIISTDNNVLGMMANGDIRGNYILRGATWTPFGSNPSSSNPGVGTSQLANISMETYQQGSNCFGCHQNMNSSVNNATTEISHVFGALKPLF